MIINRRSLITGLVSLIAAPTIVRVSSLMPVKLMEPTPVIGDLDLLIPGFYADITIDHPLYRAAGSPLRGCDLAAGQLVDVAFDGVRWISLFPSD